MGFNFKTQTTPKKKCQDVSQRLGKPNKLIVALGNPGLEYKMTRHNVGWMALDSWTNLLQTRLVTNEERPWIPAGILSYKETSVVKMWTVKPQTGMNVSGGVVSQIINELHIKPEHMCVVHDDLDLAFGDIRKKFGGGSAGHNGLKSIDLHIDTQDYHRIRIGIGRPLKESGINIIDYVLGDFTTLEEPDLSIILGTTREKIREFMESTV